MQASVALCAATIVSQVHLFTAIIVRLVDQMISSASTYEAADNSSWACENSDTLMTILKGRLGFQGWVKSCVCGMFMKCSFIGDSSGYVRLGCDALDCQGQTPPHDSSVASHAKSQAAVSGLDQEMPSDDYFGCLF